jgi:hypothetical protein
MSDKPASWKDLQQRTSGPAPNPAADDFDEICALMLTGATGERFLAALYKKHIDAPENVFGTEAALRVRAAQQQLVRDLESARDRGIAAQEARRPKT